MWLFDRGWMVVRFFFFFSSRRRHTSYIGDWSSDVCSSDLQCRGGAGLAAPLRGSRRRRLPGILEAVESRDLQPGLERFMGRYSARRWIDPARDRKSVV